MESSASTGRGAGQLADLRDSLRTRLWPLPVLAVVLATVAGVLLPRLDARADHHLPGWLGHVIFGGDAGAARSMLGAVASSLITVTALTFSLTVVTLQLASSQFSPRLLRTFTRDLFVQLTLGLFLSAFTYSLTVLRAVRSAQDGSGAFVPRLSVTVSFLLAVLSVLGLVLFLAHLTAEIRVETMLRNVHDDANGTVAAVLGLRQGQPPALPSVPYDAMTLLAPSSGFLVRVDTAELLAAACLADAVILLERSPGSAVVEGTPIGTAWRPGKTLDGQRHRQIDDALTRAVHLGYERTATQDIGYGLRQLTDVANKALSPGINDPTTAVHALGHIAALLCDLADRDLGPLVCRDDDGFVRVMICQPDLATLVDEALTQPRRYGAGDPLVMLRMYELLAELAYRIHPDEHPVVSEQLRRLTATIAAQDFDDAERNMLDRAERVVVSRLSRAVTSTPSVTS